MIEKKGSKALAQIEVTKDIKLLTLHVKTRQRRPVLYFVEMKAVSSLLGPSEPETSMKDLTVH